MQNRQLKFRHYTTHKSKSKDFYFVYFVTYNRQIWAQLNHKAKNYGMADYGAEKHQTSDQTLAPDWLSWWVRTVKVGLKGPWKTSWSQNNIIADDRQIAVSSSQT